MSDKINDKNFKDKHIKYKYIGRYESKKFILPAVLSSLGFYIRLHMVSDIAALKIAYGIAYIFLTLLLVLLYSHIYHLTSGQGGKAYAFIPAILFALFMIFGYSFHHNGNWNLVISSDVTRILKTCLMSGAYITFFYFIILWLYSRMDIFVQAPALHGFSSHSFSIHSLPPHSFSLRRYLKPLHDRPFAVSFLLLSIMYLPHLSASYPAYFLVGDTTVQIVQAYGELGVVLPEYLEGHLLSGNVLLNTHHPPVHTLFIHLCLVTGNSLFHSANIGIFIYALLQWLCVMTAISYAGKILIQKLHIATEYVALVLLYYMVSPLIQGYMFIVMKDILYSVCLMYFLIFLYALYSEETGRGIYIRLSLSGMGMFLLRNDARYILMISFLLILVFHKKLRRKAFLFLMGTVCLWSFYSGILSFCRISPGSIRETLSVPFQQTARYVAYHEEDITEAQKEAIDKILDYSMLAMRYNPNLSDSVKHTYNENASTEDLVQYFRAWSEMLLKHPGTYIQATMNNYYSYFYPEGAPLDNFSFEMSAYGMEYTNTYIEPLGMHFSYPEALDSYRSQYEKIRGSLASFPLISLLTIPSAYTWMLILLFFYSLWKKSKTAIAYLIIPCMVVLICCLLGPCNAHVSGRYLYPVMMCAPILLPMTLHLIRNGC